MQYAYRKKQQFLCGEVFWDLHCTTSRHLVLNAVRVKCDKPSWPLMHGKINGA